MFALMCKLLDQPEANSRFVYLVQGVVTSLCILILALAYVFTKDAGARSGYNETLMVLLGGGSLFSAGRALTKAAGTKTTPGCDPPVQSVVVVKS